MTAPGPVAAFKRHIQTRWIAPLIPMVARGSMRRGLAGVWWKGDERPWLPDGRVLLIANHHSWWDLYLVWWFTHRLERPMVGLMNPERLASFPFFGHHGAVPADQPRPFVRGVRAGATGIVFPQAGLQAPGPVVLSPAQAERTERLVRLTQAAVVPLAIRVLLRGGQHPEAYLWAGPPFQQSNAALERLNAMLSSFEQSAADVDPEQPLPGFDAAFQGRQPTHKTAGRLSRWWR